MPHIRIAQTVRIVSTKNPQTPRAKHRANLGCMAHPADGSYSVWAMPKGGVMASADNRCAHHSINCGHPLTTAILKTYRRGCSGVHR